MTTPTPGRLKSAFQRYLLPAVIFQSVLIGGAYATGREIVEYGAKYGAAGLWGVAAIGAGFALITGLAFELARVTGTYDYRRLTRELIGPAWPLFDILYVLMTIVVIAVVSAASGSIGEEVLGLPYALGVGLVILAVGLINAAGRGTIETFKSYGTAILYAGYAVFAGTVLAGNWGRVADVLGSGDTSYVGAVAWSAPITTGLLYVGYNLAGLPAALFAIDRQTSRRESLLAGLFTGVLSTVPFLLTYLAIMVFYPAGEVLGAEVPWLVMLRSVGGGGLAVFYAAVVLWTLVETSVGMIHAILDRVSVHRMETGRAALSPRAAGVISVALLLAAALLSRAGIIALVAQGYTLMAYGFLLLFALPLLTRGVWRILRASDADTPGRT